jgi:hypothetical protein
MCKAKLRPIIVALAATSALAVAGCSAASEDT